jgi:hypothetical protein
LFFGGGGGGGGGLRVRLRGTQGVEVRLPGGASTAASMHPNTPTHALCTPAHAPPHQPHLSWTSRYANGPPSSMLREVLTSDAITFSLPTLWLRLGEGVGGGSWVAVLGGLAAMRGGC